MKKLLALLLAICCLTTPALADVIWAPYGEGEAGTFFEAHRDEITYVDRQYLCDGYDGVVRAYNSPEDMTIVETFENEKKLNVQYIWTDGDMEWGLYVRYSGNTEICGWVPMDDLALVYDHTAFVEDHAEEITDYDGSYDDVTAAYFWTYPHSGRLSESRVLETRTGSDYYSTFGFSKTYVDEEGAVWCYVDYYLSAEGWVCVTDPLNEDIEAIEVEQVRSVAQQTGAVTISAEASQAEETQAGQDDTSGEVTQETGAEKRELEMVVALVVAVVAVSAVLITVFWRRGKRK